jgi:hypothetical protein
LLEISKFDVAICNNTHRKEFLRNIKDSAFEFHHANLSGSMKYRIERNMSISWFRIDSVEIIPLLQEINKINTTMCNIELKPDMIGYGNIINTCTRLNTLYVGGVFVPEVATKDCEFEVDIKILEQIKNMHLSDLSSHAFYGIRQLQIENILMPCKNILEINLCGLADFDGVLETFVKLFKNAKELRKFYSTETHLRTDIIFKALAEVKHENIEYVSVYELRHTNTDTTELQNSIINATYNCKSLKFVNAGPLKFDKRNRDRASIDFRLLKNDSEVHGMEKFVASFHFLIRLHYSDSNDTKLHSLFSNDSCKKLVCLSLYSADFSVNLIKHILLSCTNLRDFNIGGLLEWKSADFIEVFVNTKHALRAIEFSSSYSDKKLALNVATLRQIVHKNTQLMYILAKDLKQNTMKPIDQMLAERREEAASTGEYDATQPCFNVSPW